MVSVADVDRTQAFSSVRQTLAHHGTLLEDLKQSANRTENRLSILCFRTDSIQRFALEIVSVVTAVRLQLEQVSTQALHTAAT